MRLRLESLARFFSSRLIGALLQAVTIFVLIRNLKIEDFGNFSVVLALGNVLSGIAGLGLVTAALHGDDIDGKSESNTIIFMFFNVCLCISAILFLYGWLYIDVRAVLVLSAILLWFNESFSMVCQNVLISKSRQWSCEVFIIARRLFVLLAVIFAGRFGGDSIFNAVIVSSVLVLIVGWLVAFDYSLRLSAGAAVLRKSRYYWANSCFAMAQQLDVVIIQNVMGAAAAALYAAAFRLAGPVHIVTGAIVSLMLPLMKRAGSCSQRLVVGKKYMALGYFYSLSVLLFSPSCYFFVKWFFGDEYLRQWTVFLVLLISAAVSVINQVLTYRLYGSGLDRGAAKYTLLSTATGLLLVFGASFTGSVVVVSCSLVISQLLLFLLLRRALSANSIL